MSDKMSWRAGTSRIKGYLAQPEIKRKIPSRLQLEGVLTDGWSTAQSLTEWAGQKIRRGQSHDSAMDRNQVSLFPGWATRRYRRTTGAELEEAFEVEVFVAGFASSQRSPELATRSQRAFIRLAKGFASLPKIQSMADDTSDGIPTLTPSTEKLLASIQLPPRPTEITEDFQMDALEKQFQRVKQPSTDSYLTDSESPISRTESSSSLSSLEPVSAMETVEHHHTNKHSSMSSDLRRLHANLESRLQPFWSTALSSRIIRISVFTSPHGRDGKQENEHHRDPIATQNVVTGPDGSFQARFSVPWEDMCKHPHGLHIAFGDPMQEHDLIFCAELQPETLSSTATQSPPSTRSLPIAKSTQVSPATADIRISLSHSPVRVVSDIDDTIKLSNILSGARAVFHNVFVKELKDTVIPGMGSWYGDMYKRGVRFHYVSNGPFELLPVVNEFLQISQLPPGSLKLKSYAGRSLFNGLLSAPATRKRAGVLDILESFPLSRFFLIGDTGEQDLELYAQLASERPEQVLGVFVRDAHGDGSGIAPAEDPTGWRSVMTGSKPKSRTGSRSGSTPCSRPGTPTGQTLKPKRILSDALTSKRQSVVTQPQSTQSMTTDLFSTAHLPSSGARTTLTEEPGFYVAPGSRLNTPSAASSDSGDTLSTTSSEKAKRQGSMSEVEKKRLELQSRIHKARTLMPSHIPLRIFRNPEECVELEEILEKLHVAPSGGG